MNTNTFMQLSFREAEVLRHAVGRRRHQRTPTHRWSTDSSPETPLSSALHPSIQVDAELVMRTHAQRTVSRWFAALRQLRQINRLFISRRPHSSVSLTAHRNRRFLDYSYNNGELLLVFQYTCSAGSIWSVLNASVRVACHLLRSGYRFDAVVHLPSSAGSFTASLNT